MNGRHYSPGAEARQTVGNFCRPTIATVPAPWVAMEKDVRVTRLYNKDLSLIHCQSLTLHLGGVVHLNKGVV